MARYKINLQKFDWEEIDADTDEVTGVRVYHTPCGDCPSVTTILGTLPNPELDAWRERVGEEEADRISKEATDIGTLMHDALEAKLLGKEYIPNPDCNPDEYLPTALQMAKAIQLFGWRKMNEIWAVEMPLYFRNLYAGRTDLVGLYARHPHIMDYKTSRYVKPPEYLEKYRLQMSAYSIAVEDMFGVRFDHAVNFFAIRPNPEYKKAAESHIVLMDPEMMAEYKVKWVEIIIDYYKNDPTRFESIDAMINLL